MDGEVTPPGALLEADGRELTERIRLLAEHLVAARPGHVYREALAVLERPLIAHVLRYVGGNQLRAARMLGLNRNTLRKRCRQLDLPLPREARGEAPGPVPPDRTAPPRKAAYSRTSS